VKRLALGAALIALVAAGVASFGSLPKDTVLGAFETPLEGRTRSQRHNAVLAAKALDGVLVRPGEVFSYNRVVGTFTRDQGFRKAPVSYNGQLIDAWGGGVCQASTTLYNAALLAGMEIVERHSHRFAPSYAPPGRDAAVAYWNIDLKFRNPHSVAVRIGANEVGDRLVITLSGPEKPAHRSEVFSQVMAREAPRTYRLVQSGASSRVRNTGKSGFEVTVWRQTGPRRERISHDVYPVMNRLEQFARER
jgi:vancomycin resistance protein YoaR